MFSTVVSFVLN